MRVSRFVKPVALVCTIVGALIAGRQGAGSMYRYGHQSDYTVSCANNLKQIGYAIRVYADAHGGAFPASLDALDIEIERGSRRDVFICPNLQTAEDDTLRAMVGYPAALPASYRYLGDGLATRGVREDDFVIVERDGSHSHSVNILFGDGHVELCPATRGNGPESRDPRWADIERQIARGDRPVRYPPQSSR